MHIFPSPNFENSALILNQRGPNRVSSMLIQWQSRIFKIGWVLFFFDASYFRWRSSFFQLSQLWRAITQSVKLTTPLCYTFSEPSGRQLSHGGTMDICCSSKISINLPKCKSAECFFSVIRIYNPRQLYIRMVAFSAKSDWYNFEKSSKVKKWFGVSSTT